MPSPDFAERLAAVRARIASAARRAGRDAREVRILAVAKTAAPADLDEAWNSGQREFAHNRVQDLLRDAARLPQAVWHAVGPLQGNKVSDCVRVTACIQTVGDALSAERIARALARIERRMPVLLQVNLQPADGRYGCPLAELVGLAETARAWPQLDVRGLMTIAEAGAPPAILRAGFARLREAAERLAGAGCLPPRPELSMGMSDDYEIAVEEGANLVRIGRVLFPPTS
jgi:pyridoxal phosphate enzyme (YggS family)